MEQLQSQLLLIEQVIIGGAIAFGLTYLLKEVGVLFAYLKTKTALIKDEKVRKIADSTLDEVDNLVIKNITNADVNLKPIILQSIADGKVSSDEINSLLGIVKNNTLKQLSDDSIKVLNDSLGDVDSYLESTIEDKLATLKLDPTSAVSKTILPEKSVVVVDTTELENKNAELVNKTSTLSDTVNDLKNTNSQLSEIASSVQSENDALKVQLNQIQNALSGVTLNTVSTTTLDNVDSVQSGTVNSISTSQTLPNNITLTN